MRFQHRHRRERVVGLLLDLARIDDEHDVIDGDASLGDVRRQDDLAHAAGGRLEDAALVGALHHRVQRVDDVAIAVAEAPVIEDQVAQRHDVVITGQEYQDCTCKHTVVYV